MNLDTDREPRQKAAYQRLEQLVQEKGGYIKPTIPAPNAELRDALHLLSPQQAEDVAMHFLFGIARIWGNPFGDEPNLGTTYQTLNPAQQEQVIAYYNVLLRAQGLSLEWCKGHGFEDGHYRFELAHHPVTSR